LEVWWERDFLIEPCYLEICEGGREGEWFVKMSVGGEVGEEEWEREWFVETSTQFEVGESGWESERMIEVGITFK
jgi:hypothetical protein